MSHRRKLLIETRRRQNSSLIKNLEKSNLRIFQDLLDIILRPFSPYLKVTY